MRYSDEDIINHFKGSELERNKIFKYLYVDWEMRGSLLSFLKSKGLDKNDYFDVFKDGLIALDQAIQADRYDASKGSMYIYLKGICRYLWIEKLKKKQIKTVEIQNLSIEESDFIDQIFNKELNTAIETLLNKLSERCQKVIKLWSEGYRMKEIAEKMKYLNDRIARKSKYQCINALNKILIDNPNIKEDLRQWL